MKNFILLLAASTSGLVYALDCVTSRPLDYIQFTSNVNYRLTALLEVNGGSSSSAGYTLPIEVLTLQDPDNGKYRQRLSYYSGLEVDYNDNGVGWKVISEPNVAGDLSDGSGGGGKICFWTGGGEVSVNEDESNWFRGDEKDDEDDDNSQNLYPFLNLFPSSEQMDKYILSDLITSEPGIPYRIAFLEVPHGSHDPLPNITSHSYSSNFTHEDDHHGDFSNGMPSDDRFEFHYEVSPSSSTCSPFSSCESPYARPRQWIMLARNQIISAHTERWVLRYTSFEKIKKAEERKIWESWFDMNFKDDCSNFNASSRYLNGKSRKKLNRLGMFFSSSFGDSNEKSPPAPVDSVSSIQLSTLEQQSFHNFELFLSRHNKHYPSPDEYSKRKSIHDSRLEMIESLNEKHKEKTSFSHNEHLDQTVGEIMQYRGGYLPRRHSILGKNGRFKKVEAAHKWRSEGHLRYSAKSNNHGNFFSTSDQKDGENDGNNDEESGNAPTKYQVPEGFDPSTLPETFDWRTHLPGSVGPIKDQGICGSCWAFSLVAALESHWFIKNHHTVTIPEQFILDCVWGNYSQACDGGWSDEAALQIVDMYSGMIPTRDVYGGYLSVDGKCYVDILEGLGIYDGRGGKNHQHLQETATSPIDSTYRLKHTIQIEDWVVIPTRDDIATKHALLTQGPLSIAVNMVEQSIFYSSGVLDVEECTKNGEEDLEHAIAVVGWGVDELEDGSKAEHWLLRNSWSTFWGDGGYFKVRMGERDCGVTTAAGFPIVTERASMRSAKNNEDIIQSAVREDLNNPVESWALSQG